MNKIHSNLLGRQCWIDNNGNKAPIEIVGIVGYNEGNPQLEFIVLDITTGRLNKCQMEQIVFDIAETPKNAD